MRVAMLCAAGLILALGACVGGREASRTPPPGVPLVGTGWDNNAIGFRGQDGERFAFRCEPPPPPRIFVYGTDVYTDDSSICWAGVHAGVITTEERGVVTIEIQPGQNTYRATSRNGVDSGEFGANPGSFEVVR